MDKWMIRQTIDLAHGGSGPNVWPEALMVSGDRWAHTWEITIRSAGAVPVLTGASVTAYFNRADNVAVAIVGSIKGNTASVTLTQECYAVEGPMVGIFRLTSAEGETLTLSVLRFTVGKGPFDAIIDPGKAIPSLEDLLAQIERMENGTAAANTAAAAANSAAGKANAAAGTANTAAGNADSKASAANTAAGNANAAATRANNATGTAYTAASAANTAADKATAAANRVDTAISTANAAAANADSKAAAANTAAGTANAAASNAESKASAANTAAGNANAAANRLSGVELDVTMLPPSAEPTADVTQTDTKTTFVLGIPASNLAYATFEVDTDTMELLMHSPDGFSDISFGLNNGELEVSI